MTAASLKLARQAQGAIEPDETLADLELGRIKREGDVLGPLQGVKNRLAEFGRSVVSDCNVAPNHGWRHRFKTVGMEVGIAPRILDAIQGQAERSVADTHGDVTLKTMAMAIGKLPPFDVENR